MATPPKLNKYIEQATEPNRVYLKNIIRAKRLAGLSDLGIATHLSHIGCFLNDLGDPDAMTITRADIEDWYLEKKQRKTQSGKPPSAATIRGYLISIGVLMKSLHGEEGKKMLAGIRVKVPLTMVREEELLTDEEFRMMMRTATSERDRALLAIIYSSGARLGEVLAMNLGDVQLQKYGAAIHIPGGKTGPRDVDIFVGVPELRAWLNVHPMQGDPAAPLFVTLFPRGGQYVRLSKKTVQGMYDRLAVRAGIPEGKRVNPHAHRHKRATDVAEYLTTSDMREMFGWAAASAMPNIYVHSSRQKVRAKLAAHAGIKVPELQKPSTMVKQCPVCGCINGANDLYCTYCQTILSDRMALYDKRVDDYIVENTKDLT